MSLSSQAETQSTGNGEQPALPGWRPSLQEELPAGQGSPEGGQKTSSPEGCSPLGTRAEGFGDTEAAQQHGQSRNLTYTSLCWFLHSCALPSSHYSSELLHLSSSEAVLRISEISKQLITKSGHSLQVKQ